MTDLNYAHNAAMNGCYDEAAAVALVSIAQSLATLTRLAVATHGVCVDCNHPWTRHSTNGCKVNVASLGSNRLICSCTEPRPATA